MDIRKIKALISEMGIEVENTYIEDSQLVDVFANYVFYFAGIERIN